MVVICRYAALCYQSPTFLLNLSRACINLCYRHDLVPPPSTRPWNVCRCPPDSTLGRAKGYTHVSWSWTCSAENRHKWKAAWVVLVKWTHGVFLRERQTKRRKRKRWVERMYRAKCSIHRVRLKKWLYLKLYGVFVTYRLFVLFQYYWSTNIQIGLQKSNLDIFVHLNLITWIE